MTLIEQWDLINYIANKDYGGQVIEPDTFNALTKVVNLDLLKVKMGLPEDYQPGAPVSRQYLDATQRLTDETRFLKAFSAIATGSFNTDAVLPADYFNFISAYYVYQRNIDGVSTDIDTVLEILTWDEANERKGNWTKKPSPTNPIGIITQFSIKLFPEETIGNLLLQYIRYPTDPEFNYVVNSGYITDGGSSVEYEWPKHLHMDLTRMILGYIGINMREQQLEQYAEQHKAQGV
jgi:hypothetical protein